MMNKIKQKLNWKTFLILGLVVGLLLFFILKPNSSDVKVSQIQKGTIKEELILSGEVNADNYAKMYFESSGKIVYIGVKENQKVKKGTLLGKLDTTILNSSYQQAMSSLKAAEATVQYVHDQVKDHSADETYAQKDSRTTAEAAKDSAYEGMIQAKRLLDGASIFAPFDGYVTYVANPFSGVNVLATQLQFEVLDPDTMYFDVLADQTEVGQIEVGETVEIILDSFEDKVVSGTVEYVSMVPASAESGSSYSVKVKFNEKDIINSGLRIAMTGDVRFTIREKDDAFYVPSEFIQSDKSGKYIKTSPKGGKIYIETGLESEDNTEIIGDFSEGMKVYD